MTIVAVGLLILGLALQTWTALALGWRRALGVADLPPDPALPHLVLGGPFRFVRQPQSVAVLLILAGAAFGVRTAAVALLAGVAAAVVIAMAVRRDGERARRFGEAYARYRRVVPLLWPRPY
jgi:protein-S-isoprenylcysteine O-methyltransferase Ste14